MTETIPAGGKITYIDGKRIILDKDGKPCRSCNSLLDFRMANNARKSDISKTTDPEKNSKSAGSAALLSAFSPNSVTDDCPADVAALGRATWTFLHTMAANYPEYPSISEQAEMRSFLSTFSKVYPCWYCAEDFRKWLSEDKNQPRVNSQQDLSLWLCDAHNVVNKKLNKPVFKCADWKYRWKNGWPDGRCD